MAYSSSRVPAAESMLDLLLYLSRQKGPVRARNIWEGLELPRSTVYHLLKVAENKGFVIHYAEKSRYGLGSSASELSSAFVRQDAFTRIAAPVLARLVDEAKENAHISTLSGHEVAYLLAERAVGKQSLVTTAGVRMLAHATASGRSMLSQLDENQLQAIYSNKDYLWSDLPGTEDNGAEATSSRVRSLRELDTRLKSIRESGHAIERSEITNGLASVAVPIKTQDDRAIAAMTLTFKEGPNFGHKKDKMLTILNRHAEMLERRLAM